MQMCCEPATCAFLGSGGGPSWERPPIGCQVPDGCCGREPYITMSTGKFEWTALLLALAVLALVASACSKTHRAATPTTTSTAAPQPPTGAAPAQPLAAGDVCGTWVL